MIPIVAVAAAGKTLYAYLAGSMVAGLVVGATAKSRPVYTVRDSSPVTVK